MIYSLIQSLKSTGEPIALVLPSTARLTSGIAKVLYDKHRIWVIYNDNKDWYRVAGLIFQEIHFVDIRPTEEVVEYMWTRLRRSHAGTKDLISSHFHYT